MSRTLSISSGVTASGLVVDSGTTVEVLSGATVIDCSVASGGVLEWFGGAVVGTTTVSPGGTLALGSGAELVGGYVVSSGTTLDVRSGGIVSHAVISGGTLEVSGGTLGDGVVFRGKGGTLRIDGGTTSGIPVVSNLVVGSVIDFDGLSISEISVTSSGSQALMTLSLTGGGYLSLGLSSPLPPGYTYSAFSDGRGGTTVAVISPWIDGLADAQIRGATAKAAADGTLDHADMLAILDTVEAAIGGGTLTATQLDDLRTIAANCTSGGVTTSTYLANVLDKLVNGDVANTYWNGGDAAVALGNLTAGVTNQSDFDRLVGKWFLGTDLPYDKFSLGYFDIHHNLVQMTGTYVDYSGTPLFDGGAADSTDGLPIYHAVDRRHFNDSYFLASLASAAAQDPTAIQNMFVANGNGVYGVRFFINGKEQWVTVNSNLFCPPEANPGGAPPSFNSLWVELAEKAYAQLNSSAIYNGSWEGDGDIGGLGYWWTDLSALNNLSNNSYDTVGTGGWGEFTLAQITGATVEYNFAGDGNGLWTNLTLDPLNFAYNSGRSGYGFNAGTRVTSTSLTSIIRNALAAGDSVILSSLTDEYDKSGAQTLMFAHDFFITGCDAFGNLTINNPLAAPEGGPGFRQQFTYSLSALMSLHANAEYDTITIAATAASPGQAPLARALLSGLAPSLSLADSQGLRHGAASSRLDLGEAGQTARQHLLTRT